MIYFFILGKNPDLSAAEICAFFENSNFSYKINSYFENVLLIETKKSLKSEIMNRLGGTIKFGKIINSEFSEKIIISELKKTKTESKLIWGVSYYRLEKISNNKLKKQIKKIEQNTYVIKKQLKQQDISSRIVVSKEKNLSSVVVSKNKMLEKGAEFCTFIANNQIILGKTMAVQDFEAYSFRDFSRPAKDLLSGMLPPKLAKILINLSQTPKNQSLLDPFCGSGTILQEAALMGYEKIIGTDLSDKAIQDSLINLEWIDKYYKLKTLPQIFVWDAQKLSEKFNPNSIHGIATEPLLGPPLKGSENKKQLQQIKKDLEPLYINFFKQISKIMTPNSKITIIFPVFVSTKEKLFLNILDDVKKFGFSIKKFPPKIKTKARGSLLYYREGQKVYREIFVFEKKIT